MKRASSGVLCFALGTFAIFGALGCSGAVGGLPSTSGISAPIDIDFGVVQVGETRSLDFSIENRSGRVVSILDLKITENSEVDAYRFRISRAPTFLVAGEIAKLTVVFEPMIARGEEITSDLEIVSEVGIATVRLRARAVDIRPPQMPQLWCDPMGIDFGSIEVGRLEERRTLCTAAAGSLIVDGVTVHESNPDSHFTVAPSQPLPAVLNAGEVLGLEFSIELDAAPARPALDADVEISARALNSNDPINVLLHLGARVDVPKLWLSQRTVDFGFVALGTSNQLELELRNDGISDLEISPRMEPQSESIALLDGFAPFTLSAGASRVLSLACRPGVARGPEEVGLLIHSTDPAQTDVRVPLLCEGIATSGPCLHQVSRGRSSFGAIELFRPAEQDLWIDNVGTTECLMHSVRLESGSSPSFRVKNIEGGGRFFVPPGASMHVVVEYFPEMIRADMAELGFYVSSPMSNLSIPLTGRGTGTEPLFAAPDILDFGSVDETCAASQRTVRIHNRSPAPALIDHLELVQFAGSFALAAPQTTTGIVIAPFDNLEVTVLFTPRSAGRHTAELVVERGGPGPLIVPISADVSVNAVQIERIVTAPLGAKTDVLFVVDSSSTMEEEQTALLEAFAGLSVLESADYQIAVISTNADRCSSAGACGKFAGEEHRVITRAEQPSPAAAFAQNLGVDPSGVEHSLGLANLQRAFSPELLLEWNAGFLRRDSRLAVIVVSDGEDRSAGILEQYLDGLTLLRGFRHRELVQVSSLMGPIGGCLFEWASDNRYIDLTHMTGGMFGSLCYDELDPVLLYALHGSRTDYVLAQRPDPATIEIYMNGRLVPGWTYRPETNVVHFNGLVAIPLSGAEFALRYRQECPPL